MKIKKSLYQCPNCSQTLEQKPGMVILCAKDQGRMQEVRKGIITK